MSRRRDVSEAEQTLWTLATQDVRRSVKAKRPKRGDERGRKSESRNGVKPVQMDALAPTRIRAGVSTAKAVATVSLSNGLDGATDKKLREGRVEPQSRVDLHGLDQNQAHRRLLSFVRSAFQQHLRCVLVITGKGGAGTLRRLVPRWLEASDCRAMITGLRKAHAKHGGEGAIYVYLKRQRASS